MNKQGVLMSAIPVELVGKECKFSLHLPAIEDYRKDTHIVKEILHYSDGSRRSNLKVVENFKRPFWITKDFYRTHEQKKESEDIAKLNKFYSTESDLGRNIASRLGQRYVGKTKLREVRDSPFVYGIDVSTAALIKKAYMDRFPDAISSNQLATLDIENDVTGKKEISVISLVMNDKIHTVIRKDWLNNTRDVESQIKHLFEKHVPDTDIKKNAKMTIEILDNEMLLVKHILAKAHEWKPDFIAIWNIDYDIPYMLKVLEKYGINPKDVFSDPDIPKHLRYFRYKEGMKQKLTESGKYTPINPEEQWHSIICPSHFYWIDAMSAHRYVRAGGKTVPGGYSLNNILNMELGEKLKKLKFGEKESIQGIEWHIYMAKNKPLEYVVYNQWDCMSMIELDQKTKDLSHVMSMLSGVSDFGIFNSGPKKIIDAMHFFYIEKEKVLGTKPARVQDNKILGLDDWIVLLPSYRVKENGLQVIEENPDLCINARAHVFDSDCVSSYPSDTVAANVSRETTRREVISIGDIPKQDFKLQNINLFFGDVNAIQYCTNMFGFPDMFELEELIQKETG